MSVHERHASMHPRMEASRGGAGGVPGHLQVEPPKKHGERRRRKSLQEAKTPDGTPAVPDLPDSPDVPFAEDDEFTLHVPTPRGLAKEANISRNQSVPQASTHKRTNSSIDSRSFAALPLSIDSQVLLGGDMNYLLSQQIDLPSNVFGIMHKPEAFRTPPAPSRIPRRSSGGAVAPSQADRERAASRPQRVLIVREGKRTQCSQIIFKFTSISDDGTCPPPIRVDGAGAAVGRSRSNKISLPNDDLVAEEDHARVYMEHGTFYVQAVEERNGVGIRVATGTGLQNWPLELGTVFAAGLSEFTVTKADVNDIEVTVTAGPTCGQVLHILKSGGSIGRATDNAFIVSDRELSRRHCMVEHDPLQGFFLCDTGSTNGTYVRLQGPYAGRLGLQLGDHIIIGRTSFSINRYDFGVSEEIGFRPSMEDRTLVVQDLGVGELYALGLCPQTYAAVYDGHGGVSASAFLFEKLHVNITEALRRHSPRVASALGNRHIRLATTEQIRELDDLLCRILKEVFLTTDQDLISSLKKCTDGSTASTVLVLGSRLYCANVGDSRTVLRRGSQAIPLSRDHVPYREDEQARIERAGGYVLYRRVMGELAVSRAFGDAEFKTRNRSAGSVSIPVKTHPVAQILNARAEIVIPGPSQAPHRNENAATPTPSQFVKAVEDTSRPGLSEQLNDLLSPKTKTKGASRRRVNPPPKTGSERDSPERSRASSEREPEDEAIARGLAIILGEEQPSVNAKPASSSSIKSPRYSDVYVPSPGLQSRKGLQAVSRNSITPAPAPPMDSSAQEVLSPPRRGGRKSMGEASMSAPTIVFRNGRSKSKADVESPVHGTEGEEERRGSISEDMLAAALGANTIVTAEPEIVVRELDDTDDFLLMACDGLFDVFSNEDACETAARECKRVQDAQQVAEILSRMAIQERNSRDNVSVIFLALRAPSLWN